uniref:Uncharacterized protein n=1 Tax=Heterorhabditis bacteriophora TaxID=37862 RepID=A0A1I7WTN0_HETBA
MSTICAFPISICLMFKPHQKLEAVLLLNPTMNQQNRSIFSLLTPDFRILRKSIILLFNQIRVLEAKLQLSNNEIRNINLEKEKLQEANWLVIKRRVERINQKMKRKN